MKDKVAKLDPLVPSRADYRFIRRLLSASYGSKVEHIIAEYDAIGEVFARKGGSWQRLFLGSSEDITLLKSIIRVAYKKGFLTKAQAWK